MQANRSFHMRVETGGKVTDLRGQPYVPGAGSILASNMELHPLILDKLDAAA